MVQYSLDLLEKTFEFHLNYTLNELKQKVRLHHPYLYQVMKTPFLDEGEVPYILITAISSKGRSVVAIIYTDLSYKLEKVFQTSEPFPSGVESFRRVKSFEQEEFELYSYTRYMIQKVLSFFA